MNDSRFVNTALQSGISMSGTCRLGKLLRTWTYYLSTRACTSPLAPEKILVTPGICVYNIPNPTSSIEMTEGGGLVMLILQHNVYGTSIFMC